MALPPNLVTYRRRGWREEILDLTDICRKIAEDISGLKNMENVGQKEKNSKADDSYGEIYIYSDDEEVEVVPYKKKPPEVVTLNESGDIVPEADIVAADIEKLKDETLETLATIYHEIETCNDAEQKKKFQSMLLDIKKKLKEFDADLWSNNN